MCTATLFSGLVFDSICARSLHALAWNILQSGTGRIRAKKYSRCSRGSDASRVSAGSEQKRVLGMDIPGCLTGTQLSGTDAIARHRVGPTNQLGSSVRNPDTVNMIYTAVSVGYRYDDDDDGTISVRGYHFPVSSPSLVFEIYLAIHCFIGAVKMSGN